MKKKNRLIRYAKASRRSLRRIKRRNVSDWVEKNIKGHPFISGLLFFAWLTSLIKIAFRVGQSKDLLIALLRMYGIVFIAWLVLVLFSNALRDIQKVKWYFRKRFIFILLFLFYPLGAVLLWTGSKFKKKTKVIFTIIFGLFFLASLIYQEASRKMLLNKSTFDRIADLVVAPKKKIFIPPYNAGPRPDLKLIRDRQKDRKRLAVSEIYARYSPGIVSIKTKDKFGRELGLGSGFIVSQDGFIVTNYHVLASAYQVEVNIGNTVLSDVRLVKAVPQKDIAILKVKAQGLSPLVIGDSDELISGQIVVSLGSPLGLEYSVSSGIVSAIRSGKDMKLIQMTAPISLGSSGGPVFNEYGEVVGITTIGSFFFAQNVNFAVPINYLESIISQK